MVQAAHIQQTFSSPISMGPKRLSFGFLLAISSLKSLAATPRGLTQFQPLNESAIDRHLNQKNQALNALCTQFNDPLASEQWYLESAESGGSGLCEVLEVSQGQGAVGAVIDFGHLQTNGLYPSDIQTTPEEFINKTIQLSGRNGPKDGVFTTSLLQSRQNNGVGILGISPQASIYKIEAFSYKTFNGLFFDNFLSLDETLGYLLGAPIAGLEPVSKTPSVVLFGVNQVVASEVNDCSLAQKQTLSQGLANSRIFIAPIPESRLGLVGIYPWDCKDVVHVGATDQFGRFSKVNLIEPGDQFDILAPGAWSLEFQSDQSSATGLVGLDFDGGTIYRNSAKVAATLVTGLALNAHSFCPDLTQSDFVWSLQMTAVPLNGTCPQSINCGPGRLNAGGVLEAISPLEICGGRFTKEEVASCLQSNSRLSLNDCLLDIVEAGGGLGDNSGGNDDETASQQRGISPKLLIAICFGGAGAVGLLGLTAVAIRYCLKSRQAPQ